MVTYERTRRVALNRLHAQAKKVGKASLALIKDAYIEWTHDNVATDISLNAWQEEWAKAHGTLDKATKKYVIDEYSFAYICKEMRSLRVAHEGGYALSDIKKVGQIREFAKKVSGEPDAKPERSAVDVEFARIEKLSTREQRALLARLAKKFG